MTLFIKKDKGDILLVQVYVDDIIFGSTKKSLCTKFESLMHKKFQMSSMGELTFFLELQVMQRDDGIFISQDKYVADILKKFDFVTMKTSSTPTETNKALLKDEEAEDVDVHLYRSMIESLIYLTTSRPDIMFAVCACARFQVTPKVSHLHAVKRIFRYLKGQPKLGLWYPRDSPFDLEAFLDSDYAGASLDRKSTTGGCQFLGKRLISWQRKKQTMVANSTTKAGYVAAANCCRQVLWIQNQMLAYRFNFMNTKIYIDNESTICIVKNPVFHSKTKHIEIRHHFIRDSYEKKLIQVIKIHTDHNVTDLLTKAFDVSRKAKRTTEISQSSGPIPLVTDETFIKEWEDRMERAATTASSLEAEQDIGNINRTQSIETLNESFPQGTDSGSGPRLYLLLPVLVYAARHTLTAVRHKLMLPGITCYLVRGKYDSQAKTINGERQIQALVDKKKVIITVTSIRSDLKLDDAEGTYCLPTATIFVELERIGAKTTSWNEFSSTMASAIICLATNKNFNFSKYIFDNMVKNLEGGVNFLMYPRFVQVFLDKQVEGMSRHKGIYVIPYHTKKVFANMKRPGKGFYGKVTPLFETMMVQATEDMGEDSAAPIDSHSTLIHTQPSSSKPQKKRSRRKYRKDSGPTEPIPDKAINEGHVATPSCDPPQSVLALETTKSNQALEIKNLKRRVKSLEKRRKSRTPGFKRLRKVGSVSRVESSNDVSLGAQEDASKKGRKIADLDADAEVTLVDETQEMNDDNLMFDTGVLEEQEKEVAEKEVSVADLVTTAGEVVTTANVEVTTANAPTTTIDKLTMAQTLIDIKAAKHKAVTSAATTTTTTRPKARGVAKDKGKAKMVEPEKPLKKKDKIAMDEEVSRNLKAQLQAELEEEERISRLKEEKVNIALLESWDNTQAMMDADF
ncbi:putative ribonuclease H-like domain-containing protein [Tanacetum coccineum]